MKHTIIALMFAACLFNGRISAQWNMQLDSANTDDLYSVYAIDTQFVAAAGYQGISVTTNGGLYWKRNVTISAKSYYTIHTGVPTGWWSLGANTTWKLEIILPNTVSLSSGPMDILALHFRTPSCVVAVGISGATETSCDSGSTWTSITPVTTQNLNSVWFADSNKGCACGATGTVIRTTDGGATWKNVINSFTTNLFGITFPTPSTGYMCGAKGAFFKSTDTGATWISMKTSDTNNLKGVYFINADTGYVVGTGGLIMQTMNGGTSWTTMVSGTTVTLNSIHFPTPTCGWAVGDSGVILKYGSILTGINSYNYGNTSQLYPNPNNGSFAFTYSLSREIQTMASFKMMDIAGRVVYEQELKGNNGTISIDNLYCENGLYLWETLSGNKILSQGKVVIEK
jgi:photosystem II stability/assembly factor-like uncharacterized protein